MTHSVRNGLVGILVITLGGCTGTVGRTGDSGGSSSGVGGAPAGGGSPAGAAGGAGPAGGTAVTCVPGIPATSQLRRMENWQYDAVVRDLLGITTVASGSDSKPPSALLYPDFAGPMVPDAWRLYQDVGAAIAKAVMADPVKLANFMSCDPSASGCLVQTIKAFGRKAFRRPLADAEVARFQMLGQTTPAGTPADVAEATLLGFLVSPSFLMIPELNTTPDSSGRGLQLSSYEIAARLSFMLWGSVPDDALNAAADANQLQTKDQILAQAQRMIAVRDKTAPLLSAFHRHWVQMDNVNAHWWKLDHDMSKYPLYSPSAKTSFQSELDSFFAEIAFTNGTFKDLFTSNIGFVNKDNAAIYGLDATKYGDALTKVALDSVERPGFMTRAGFLSSYAHYDETAPILRGAFITVYMIGVDPGPPLAGATMLTAPAGNYKTNREKTDALVNMSATCMGCHTSIINPPGYVLENYDAIGKWQTVDPLGGPINATAIVNFGDGNQKAISSPQQLMQEIANTPKARQNYAQYWVSYAYARDPNANDQCIADQVGSHLAQDGYTILNLLADLTQSDSFRTRVRASP